MRVFVIAIVVLGMAAGAYLVILRAEQSRAALPVLGAVPEFELTAQDGRTFTRQDLHGKINVMDFIFTRCQGPCPIMSGYMTELYNLYQSTDEVRFVSISVDPDYDSIGVLQAYARQHGVTDGRWTFLTGSMDRIKSLSEQGFMLAADELPAGHSTRFILVDGEGSIRGYYDGTDQASINILKSNIAQLVKQLK